MMVVAGFVFHQQQLRHVRILVMVHTNASIDPVDGPSHCTIELMKHIYREVSQ